MQARLTGKVFVPFSVLCLKTFRDVGADGPKSGGDGRFNKKPLFEKGNMIPQSKSPKRLEAFLDGFAVPVQVNSAKRHRLQRGIKPIPQKTLIYKAHPIFPERHRHTRPMNIAGSDGYPYEHKIPETINWGK